MIWTWLNARLPSSKLNGPSNCHGSNRVFVHNDRPAIRQVKLFLIQSVRAPQAAPGRRGLVLRIDTFKARTYVRSAENVSL